MSSARAAGAGIAAADVTTDANAPDLDELVEASADRAEHAGDGPDVVDQWEPARPLIDETHVAAIVATVRSVMLGSPTPGESVAIKTTVPAGTAQQVCPPGGGRPRTVHLFNSEIVTAFVAPDRREDSTGIRISANTDDAQLVTTTDGPIFAFVATGGGDGEIGVWVDYHSR